MNGQNQFMYLPKDILERCSNIVNLIKTKYQKELKRLPTNFLIKRKLELAYDTLRDQCESELSSLLMQLEFIWPKTEEKM